jgi:hypothetical protein
MDDSLVRQLEAIAKSQQATTEALKTLTARNPAKEFQYGEGNVGSNPLLRTYETGESFKVYKPVASAFGTEVFQSNIDVHAILIQWAYTSAAAAGSAANPRHPLRVRVSKTPDFTRAPEFFIRPRPVQYLTSFVPATGVYTGDNTLQWRELIPMKYRFVEVELWQDGISVAPVKPATAINTIFANGYTGYLTCNFFGQ